MMKLILILFVAAVILVAVAEADQPGMIAWWTMDAGATQSQSAHYKLLGTAGQPDAATSSGATYTAQWGYWHSAQLHTVDVIENGILSVERYVSYGDLLKASAFLIVTLATVARWMVRKWSLD